MSYCKYPLGIQVIFRINFSITFYSEKALDRFIKCAYIFCPFSFFFIQLIFICKQYYKMSSTKHLYVKTKFCTWRYKDLTFSCQLRIAYKKINIIERILHILNIGTSVYFQDTTLLFRTCCLCLEQITFHYIHINIYMMRQFRILEDT